MDEEGELVNVATETFKYGLIPWAGRRYEEWVRTWAQPHPRDERGLVQVPRPIYEAFQQHLPGQRLSAKQAAALGYPRVPGERELARVRRELHEALGRCDWDRAHDLDAELRQMETRVAATRVTALRPHSTLAR